MTTPVDFVPLLTSDLRKLSADQWRDGDVVFYYAPGKGSVRPQVGYTVMASATERYLFDPYVANAHPKAHPLPVNTQLWYHTTIPIDPKHLHLEDALALLWSVHRKAIAGKESQLIEQEAMAFAEGELLLSERLEGYLSLDIHGQELPYPEPKTIKKRFRPAKKQKLLERYMQHNLLRLVAADPKRIRFLSR